MVKFNITQVNEVMWTYLADKATVHESLTEQKKTLTSSDQFSEILQPVSSWKVKKATTCGKAMDPNLCLDRRQSWFFCLFFFFVAIFSSWNVLKMNSTARQSRRGKLYNTFAKLTRSIMDLSVLCSSEIYNYSSQKVTREQMQWKMFSHNFTITWYPHTFLPVTKT